MNKLLIIVIAITICLVIYKGFHPDVATNYKVQLTFCDERKPIVIVVSSFYYPSNGNIETFRTAVPKYEGYLNVCDVKVLKILKP